MVPLPVSSAIFQELFTVLGIPRIFLRILLSNLPMALRFTPAATAEDSGAGISLERPL
jgi:hypothetical protein